MQYRQFPGSDWQASILGFGCMRLPTHDANPIGSNIDENNAIEMIRYAIDQGVNYVDTAYRYHGGNSEIVLGKALKEGYRSKVKIATKSPTWMIEKADDFDTYLDEQLRRLETDHIDFYLLHGLGKERWHNVVLNFNLLEKAEAARQDGRIGRLGFSFHDDFNSFKEIVDGYESWDFCQIQYNYMDINSQAGTRGLKYAAEKGLGIIVMEPLLGGKLAKLPQDILAIFQESAPDRSSVDWALQWVWNHPEVSVVLSGMSTLDQVEENLACAGRAKANSLGDKEEEVIESVRNALKERMAVPCTGCRYCLPCPQGVLIPSILELYNDGVVYEDMPISQSAYSRFIQVDNRADKCTQCGACEEKCPQKISISRLMPEVHKIFNS